MIADTVCFEHSIRCCPVCPAPASIIDAKDALLAAAYSQGRLAGQHHLPPSLNPFPERSPEAGQWLEGRMSMIAENIGRYE